MASSGRFGRRTPWTQSLLRLSSDIEESPMRLFCTLIFRSLAKCALCIAPLLWMETAAGQAGQAPTAPALEALVQKAEALVQAGKYDAALQAGQEAVAASEANPGVDPPLAARAYSALGQAQAYKQMPEAEATLKRALALREAHFGDERLEVAQSLASLAFFYRLRGNYQAAEPLYQRALTITERVCGPEHPDLAATLNNTALFYKTRGDYAAAEPLYRRALAIREKALGAEHPDTAATLNNLAELLRTRGEYAAAEPLYGRALAIFEKTLGEEHPNVATALTNLALLHKDRGDYRRAEPYFQKALALREKIFGPEHPEVATAASNLAELYRVRGDYAPAEPLYRRAIAIRERKLGPDHVELGIGFNNLAAMYRDRGDYAMAEPLYKRALGIWEKALGLHHPLVASALNNLGELYRLQDKPAAAKPLIERARQIREKALGERHPLVAVTLINLGAVELALGDDAAAEAAFQRALSSAEQSVGRSHPLVASALNHLGRLHQQRGNYAEAEQLFQRSFQIREQALEQGHPDLALSASHLAWLYLASGRAQLAGDWLARATNLSEADFRRNLVIGSERQKTLYAQRGGRLAEAATAWQARYFPNEAAAARLALLAIWRHKGRALDALANQTALLRARATADERRLLDDLEALRNRLTQLAGKPDAQAERARLESDVERLESQVGERFAQLGAQLQLVAFEPARAALPKDAALVEYFIYRPLDDDRPGQLAPTPHLAAYALPAGADAPRLVKLGDLATIEARIAAFRQALRERQPDAPAAARALDEKLLAPVRPLLGKAKRLFIAPDGSANLIPFEALVDERGRYLVERYDITLLTSGRDLARLGSVKAAPRRRGLVLADPRYDLGDGAAARPADGPRSADFQAADYPPLPATQREAQFIRRSLRDVEAVSGDLATEARLKATRAPWCLHIATHGFFLSEQSVEPATSETRQLGLAAEQNAAKENPLLRSGLILAGARQGRSGEGEDGVLTALEAAGLELWGTQLVTLSACETGLGETRPGEGVYGLRRALVIAGAETQVMSLWKVSDAATAALMTEYYRRLARGEGRAAALQAARLKFLRGEIRPRADDLKRELGLSPRTAQSRFPGDWRHPYYWAAFVVSGDWRPLDHVGR
ncbi:MAG: kinesin [Chloracidobacterium sp. CP2_5A]|nr:MAG: kinesin [Chloracidobacterium sp. CP2_5A]